MDVLTWVVVEQHQADVLVPNSSGLKTTKLTIWYNGEGTRQGCNLLRPLLAVPNVTAHLIAVLLYNSPLLCSFNVSVKLLNVDSS